MGFDISVLIDQMKIIATLMLIGFIWKRSRLFNDDLVNSLSAILAKLILPLMPVSYTHLDVYKRQSL